MTAPTGLSVYTKRLKAVVFTLGGVSYDCQLNNWTMNNNTVDGTKTFSYCAAGGQSSEFRTETDSDYSLSLKFFSDWRAGGISEFLWLNTRAISAFVLDHYPDIVGSHVRWSGNCVIKAPSVGGEIRTIEETSVTLLVLGVPTYARVG